MSDEGSTPRAVRQAGELVASKYRLERPLAQGGMGSLWVARHVELDVEVAIKFSAMERNDAHDQRFRREARAAARLKSAHIVQVFDYGFDGGEPYIAMELLEGESLRDLLEREGSLPLHRAAALVAEIAKGLQVAHEAGIVHRDLKPSNLFLSRVGGEQVVKIVDFGIAKAAAEAGNETAAGVPNLGSEATRVGTIIGSPAYMSPEQASGELVDQRSDLWSLAVVTFRLLTGVVPFTAATPAETLDRILSAPLPPMPEALAGFFARGLARSKEQRFQSAQELSSALEALITRGPREAVRLGVGEPKQRVSDGIGRTAETRPIEPEPTTPSRRRSLRAAAGALAVAVSATLGLYLWASRGPAGSEPTPSEPNPTTLLTTTVSLQTPVAATERPPVPAESASELTASATPARQPRRKPSARPALPAETTPPANSSPKPAEPPEIDPVFGLQR
jgi:eukaryotic-like serine/threonine-protein kinase